MLPPLMPRLLLPHIFLLHDRKPKTNTLLLLTVPPLPPPPGPALAACPQFGGARAGYVFKVGPSGLGYYLDKPWVNRRLGEWRREAGRGSAAALPFSAMWADSLLARRGACGACPSLLVGCGAGASVRAAGCNGSCATASCACVSIRWCVAAAWAAHRQAQATLSAAPLPQARRRRLPRRPRRWLEAGAGRRWAAAVAVVAAVVPPSGAASSPRARCWTRWTR